MNGYGVMQMGYVTGCYATRGEAQAECDRLNAEMLDECGQDMGDGAACVVEVEVQS